MAKEKTAPTKAQATTVENIEEQIKSENKMEESVVKAAEEAIKKEKDEKKKNQMKEAIMVASYINGRELLNLRKQRAEEKAIKESLEASKKHLDDLKEGKLTPREYEKAISEVVKKKKEAFDEAAKKHKELCDELRDNFPNYYSLEWEYNQWSYDTSRSRFGW